jgi:hypothetical protein
MAEQTFTSGQVLTAAQMTTLQTNIGLAFVTSVVAGTGVNSVSVSNCFTSTYDNYKIIYTGGVGTGAQACALNLLPTTQTGWNTSYSMNVSYCAYGGAVTNLQTLGGAQWGFAGEVSTTNKTNINFELLAPNLAQFTGLTNFYVGEGGAGAGAGIHTIASAFTGFTISGSSSFSGGTVYVYGYRKA